MIWCTPKQIEELSDALRRALINAKMTSDLAETEVIEKAIDLCRSNTQNVTVKSVLASTKFDSPKDVAAKFIVECNKTTQEAQILSLRQFNKNNRDRNFSNSNQQGGNRTNGRFANNGNRQYNNNNGNYNRQNQNFNTQRGNYRNRQQNYNNNYNDNSNSNYNFNRRNDNFYNENYDTPPQFHGINAIHTYMSDENEYGNTEFESGYENFNENDNNDLIHDESMQQELNNDQNNCYETQSSQILNINVGTHSKDFINFATDISRDLVSALVDSQGDISLIKCNTLLGKIKINRKIRQNITGVTPGIVKTMGIVLATIKIDKMKITHPFHVVPNDFPIQTNGLVGTDFLHKYKCILNYFENTITIGAEKLRMYSAKTENSKNHSARENYISHNTNPNGKFYKVNTNANTKGQNNRSIYVLNKAGNIKNEYDNKKNYTTNYSQNDDSRIKFQQSFLKLAK